MTEHVEMANPKGNWAITFTMDKGGRNPRFVNVDDEEVERIRHELSQEWRKYIVIELNNDAGIEMIRRKSVVCFTVRRDK